MASRMTVDLAAICAAAIRSISAGRAASAAVRRSRWASPPCCCCCSAWPSSAFSTAGFSAALASWAISPGLMLPPNPGDWAHVRLYAMSLIETVAISLLGTLARVDPGGAAGPARRQQRHHRSGSLHFLSRRSLDTIRSVDILIWALIWINVVGLGPFAGVLAIMTSDIGNFGKLFSEAIEAADRRPVEGIVSTGGGPHPRHPLRHPARGLPGAGEPGALLLRIQHPLGHHHRHRRRGRHRPASRRGDPHARAAAGLVHHPDDPGRRRRHRRRLEPAALRPDRPTGAARLERSSRATPSTTRRVPRKASPSSPANGWAGAPSAGRARPVPLSSGIDPRAPGRDHRRAAALWLSRHAEAARSRWPTRCRRATSSPPSGSSPPDSVRFTVPSIDARRIVGLPGPGADRRARPSCRISPTAASSSSTSSAGPPTRQSWRAAARNGLSPRQDELLKRWGYPYVLEEWRFHLTLTGRMPMPPSGRPS